MKMQVENMTETQQEEARQATEENPDVVTVVNRNGKTRLNKNKKEYKPKYE